MTHGIHLIEKLGRLPWIILIKDRAQNCIHFKAGIISISGKQSGSMYTVFSDSRHHYFYIQFY